MFVFNAVEIVCNKEQQKYIYIYVVSHHTTNVLFMTGKSNSSSFFLRSFFYSISKNVKKKGIDRRIKENER